MFRKTLTAVTTVAVLSAPLAAQARPHSIPAPDPRQAVTPAPQPTRAAPRQSNVDSIVALTAMALIVGAVANGR